MNPHLPADTLHRIAMEKASWLLAYGIKQMRAGRNPDLGNKLVWNGSNYPKTVDKLYPRAAVHMAEREEARARVVTRDPCPKCGTRQDIGCKHRRVA